MFQNAIYPPTPSGPALPHSHSPLKGRYDKLYSLSGNIIHHSSYYTPQTTARMVYWLKVDTVLLLTNGIQLIFWVFDSWPHQSLFATFYYIWLGG